MIKQFDYATWYGASPQPTSRALDWLFHGSKGSLYYYSWIQNDTAKTMKDEESNYVFFFKVP